ncbi:hypothetical protein [Chryseobacterium indologenes]|uniref:Lipoprotein n=1 Tax=Chryseobacterium indologenes TaxID=253 RepID=A0A0N0IUD3_CHRID|nr:hypothetical protein [Chryseobacterium indologenes]KPE49551.1 hypothetical protein AOB46_19605 [Chryseobacterium indologenes]
MRKKLNLKRLLLVLLAAFFICSCSREDLLQQETPKETTSVSSAKYASRSLWKEDDVYIGKVQQVFLKYANLERFNTAYGELYWNYAMSFGQFGEKYLLVPIVKKNKVVLLMEAVRKGDKVYFYKKNDTDLLAFFQHVLYSNIISHSEVMDGNQAAAKAKYVCSTRTIVIGCLNGQTDCEPVSYSHMVCEWQEDSGGGIPPASFPPLGDPFGGGGGGGGSDGYEYPDPPDQDLCGKVKAQNTDSNFKAKTEYLKSKTSNSYESGFRVGNPAPGSGQTGVQYQELSNKPGTTDLDFKIFNTTYGVMHSHYDGLIPIFSPGDINLFIQLLKNAKANNIPLSEVFLSVVTSQGTYQLRGDDVNVDGLSLYSSTQIEALNIEYSKMIGNPNISTEGLQKGFLEFMEKNMNIDGAKLYETNSDGSSKQLQITGGNFTTSNCP